MRSILPAGLARKCGSRNPARRSSVQRLPRRNAQAPARQPVTSTPAANPELGAVPLLLALVLFLWTPPHFWSLAIANSSDYTAAGVPMLPVVVGDARAAQIVFASALVLVGVSLLPVFFGAGPIYFAGALAGGAHFVHKAWLLARAPSRKTAMRSFHASLAQLSLLLLAAMTDALLF